MMTFAWDIYHYMPPGYFDKAQAPLIRIHQESSVYALQHLSDHYNSSFTNTVKDNKFHHNENYQIVTFDSLQYKASLLEYICEIDATQLVFDDNTVEQMQFIGDASVLIYIDGGVATMQNNAFRYIGSLANEVINNTLSSVKFQYKKVYNPYEDYSFTKAQYKGVVNFDFWDFDVPTGFSHRIYNNFFEAIHTIKGAAISITGSKIQQFDMSYNSYSFLVSEEGAGILADLELPPSNTYTQVFIMTL